MTAGGGEVTTSEPSERQKERMRARAAHVVSRMGAAVIEYHYSDGDVGAYATEDAEECKAVHALWLGFAYPRDGHMPTKIVIRARNAEDDE